MSAYLAGRRRLVARNGRPMQLSRAVAVGDRTTVALRGVFSGYKPEQWTAGVIQGDGQVATLNDEIEAAGWPGPPRTKDSIMFDGATWRVMGALVVRDGVFIIGHLLWVRGGAP